MTKALQIQVFLSLSFYAAGISILLDEDDDPEAKESAQNLGAILGLAAGVALAVEHHRKIKEADAPEEATPVWEQSMG